MNIIKEVKSYEVDISAIGNGDLVKFTIHKGTNLEESLEGHVRHIEADRIIINTGNMDYDHILMVNALQEGTHVISDIAMTLRVSRGEYDTLKRAVGDALASVEGDDASDEENDYTDRLRDVLDSLLCY